MENVRHENHASSNETTVPNCHTEIEPVRNLVDPLTMPLLNLQGQDYDGDDLNIANANFGLASRQR